MRTIFLLAVVAGAGCGGRSDKVPLYPVEGSVRVAGQPASGARLMFHPEDGLATPVPFAVTGPDGQFQVTTYSLGDGAPAGDYVVTLESIASSLPAFPTEGVRPSSLAGWCSRLTLSGRSCPAQSAATTA